MNTEIYKFWSKSLILFLFYIFTISNSCRFCNGCNSVGELSIQNCYGDSIRVELSLTEEFIISNDLKDVVIDNKLIINMGYPERKIIGKAHYQKLKSGEVFKEIAVIRKSKKVLVDIVSEFNGIMDTDVSGEIAIPMSICL